VGVNSIVLEYTDHTVVSWNVGFHKGALTGYIGNITVEYVHL
jgi:hypothetical protein